jgi:kumamolisin
MKTQFKFGALDTISGLDHTRKSHPRIQFGKRFDGTAAQPGILPAQIKTAYGFDGIYKAGWTGKGEHIAIATYDGFYMSDITDYYKLIGLTTTPTVDQVTFNGTPAVNEDSAAETQLDAEFSGHMAPGASIHIFASAENSDAGEEAMFTAILDDNRAKVANYSWGSCEPQTAAAHKTAMDKIFARAVAQGVNIMVASGDSGNDGCQDGGTDADWPAAHPDVVGVGGTSLTLNTDNTIQAESGWNNGGGGVSSLYDIPTWQTGALSTTSFKKRSFPDVAFNADNVMSGQAIWTHYGSSTGKPAWLTIGGTSMAAPQWSGLLTLVNEARVAGKKTEIGFLNPVIYGASGAVTATILNDVTTGNNGYAAGTGWDAVTGLGSPQATGLLNFLITQ